MVVGIAFCNRWNDERCYRCGFGEVVPYDNGSIMTTRIVIKSVWKYFRYIVRVLVWLVLRLGASDGRWKWVPCVTTPKPYQFQ